MYEANVVDDSRRANELWGLFDRNVWWRSGTNEGRLSRIHLDRFLNHWVVMSIGQEVNADNVSAEFTKHLESSALSIDEVARAIRNAGQVYQDLEEARTSGIEAFLRRMKTMEIGVVMPLLLWMYTTDIPDHIRKRSVGILESYLIRRMICGVGSQGLNRLFVELLARLKSSSTDTVDQVIADYLTGQTVENRIWPNDSMLYEHLVGTPLKGTVGRQTMVLEAIELQLRTSKTEDIGAATLTREHIMPESWQRNWPLPQETRGDEAANARDQAIKEIGNLTLVTGRLNTSLSNSAWSQKKNTLRQHTSLRLNWELLDGDPEVWNEEAIRERSQSLAAIVLKIWPFGNVDR